MPSAPVVTVPGLLSNAKAPHVSSIAAFDTFVQILNNSGRAEDQATAQALQQISNALNLITSSMIQSKAFSFNVPVSYHNIASANLTLSTAYQLVPGLSITLPTSGQYFIVVNLNGTGDVASGAILTALFIDGVQFTSSSDNGSLLLASTGTFGTSRFYTYNAQAGDIVTAQCQKANNAGNTVIFGGNAQPDSTLTAIWLHAGLSQLPSVTQAP
jgi:hypothetical protein